MNSTNHSSIKPNRTIFLAEDDIDDQEFLAEAFDAIDPSIQLVSFSSGIKFIDHLQSVNENELPGLIVLDYNIPELNGEEILRQLNAVKHLSSIPKVIWSTSNSQLFRKNCLELGAKAYFIKPTSISGIREVAEQMLHFCR